MQEGALIAEKNGKYKIFWEEFRGSVFVKLNGFWSPNDMQDFVAPLEFAIDKSRSRHGNALLLFDATENKIMPSSLFGGVKADSEKLSSPKDRVAIVVASSLLKLQMKRFSSANSNTEFFLSRAAACTWLHAYILPPRERNSVSHYVLPVS